MSTIFQLKEDLSTLGTELKAISTWIAENAADPSVKMEEINAKTEKRKEVQARFDMLKAEHDRLEAEEKAKTKKTVSEEGDPVKAKLEAKGKFYKAALTNGNVQEVVRAEYQKLGAIPQNDADLGHGENLLPVNVSNEIIAEPFDTNPMRGIMTVSNITNLEMPKMAYTVDDDSFINDKATAKELELDAGKVKFGRFKTKVKATVSDTVLRGTNTNLASFIDEALRSGLATKEKKVMFAKTPASGEEHMSFYSSANNITTVTGSTMLEAILKAIGDLPDAFAEKAKIVMKRADYINMIKELANNNATLWGMKPEDIIGYPVIFVDKAETPIVGDFSYAQINYDIGSTYDTDKDVDSGDFKFVLTAWFDVQIKLKSAFRLVSVVVEEPEEPGTSET